ncbi:MAG: DNA-directed DNA polymerase I [Desulfurococcaceae archaeon]
MSNREEVVSRINLSLPFKASLVKTLHEPHYLVGVYYDGKIGKAVLQFLTEDGAKLVNIVDMWNHKPYFLTDESVDKLKEIFAGEKDVEGLEEVEKIDPLSMQRIRVTKVITKDPLVVKRLRNKVRSAWEAKIKYHANYIFDVALIPGMKFQVLNEGSPKLVLVKPRAPEEVKRTVDRIFEKEPELTRKLAEEFMNLFEEPPPRAQRVAVDIEVYTPFKGRIPSARLAEYPVISIAVAGYDGFRKVFMLARNFKHSFMYAVEQNLYPANAEIEIYDSERALILDFLRTVSKYPVILTYNGDNFDLLYLYTRSLKLGVPRYMIPFRVGEEMVKVEFALHIDLYKFFSNRAIKNYAFGGKYQEEKLDAVASALLGISKIGFEETVSEISAGLLATYNLRDAEITLMLTTFNDELTWKLIVLMARISKTSIEELCRKQISTWIQNLFFWEHRRLNYLIRNKEDIEKLVKSTTRATIEGKKYAGALVVEPPRGVFFNVVVLDIASLYPSIIKNYNLSYETVDMPWCKKKQQIVDETGKVLHYVCLDAPGLTAQLVGILRDFRVEVYKKKSKDPSLTPEQKAWYDVVQRAIKVFVNASYGVFGDERFPLYSPAVAESVTALGRRSFMSIVIKAAEMGIKTLYGDTDSIFVWASTQKQLELLQKWVQQTLGLDIELDKEFTYAIFTGLKKNYLGRTKSGEIEIKGLIVKKRNTPEFMKILFNNIIDTIRKVETPEDIAGFITWIEKVTREYYHGLKQKEIPLDQLAIKTTLSKDLSTYVKNKPQHVKAALQLKQHGIDVQENDVIVYVKIKGGDGVKAIQLARQHEVDPEKYIETLKTGLEQFLSALGIKWEDIVSGELSKAGSLRELTKLRGSIPQK